MKTIISGSNHFIIPKKIVFTAFMVGLGAFFGMYLSEHLHAKRTETFLKKKNDSVKDANTKLVKEKSAYQSIFDELKDHLADWEKGRDMSLVEQAEHVTSFHEQARELLNDLSQRELGHFLVSRHCNDCIYQLRALDAINLHLMPPAKADVGRGAAIEQRPTEELVRVINAALKDFPAAVLLFAQDPLDLGVDDASGLIAVVAGLHHVFAQEDLAL